jgi:hypothetical protein
MTNQTDTQLSVDPEEADRLTREVFTPALQTAVKQARENGSGSLEMLHGAANAYQHLLVSLLSDEHAAGIMRDHADHLDRLAKERAGKS